MIFDGSHPVNVRAWDTCYGARLSGRRHRYPGYEIPTDYVNGTVNIYFFDGHVESARRKDLPKDGAGGDAYNYNIPQYNQYCWWYDK